MNSATRRIFFRLYTVFFLIITPFIVVYSLGYNFDLNSRMLVTNLIVNISTLPSGSDVQLGEDTFTTPLDLRLSSSAAQPITISEQGYASESLVVWSDLHQNSNVNLKNLVLLPQESETITSFSSATNFLNFLPGNKILYAVGDILFLQDYSLSSIGSPITIVSELKAEDFSTGNWESLQLNYYWNHTTGTLLYLDPVSTTWQAMNLQSIVLQATDIARVSSNRFLIIDELSNLYSWEPSSSQISFLDSGYFGVEARPQSDSVWLSRSNGLARINKNRLNYENILASRDTYLIPFEQSTSLNTPVDLQVSHRAYRGTIVRAGSDLFYIADNNPGVINTISRTARLHTIYNNAVFYSTATGALQMYDFDQDRQKNLALVKDTQSLQYLTYDPSLKRLLMYSGDGVQAIWVEPQEIAPNIISHPRSTWVDTNYTCQRYISNRSLVCFSRGELMRFTNLRRF